MRAPGNFGKRLPVWQTSYVHHMLPTRAMLDSVLQDVLGFPSGRVLEGPIITNKTSFAFLARFPEGTNYNFRLTDADGSIAETSPLTIRPGPTNC
ncbi:hypothetical protein C8Q79DRAFT_338851 [Trametes meyenii]|nr:hypothetical protein C8Q79DRAFT_338851 [Trametes meyenii]